MTTVAKKKNAVKNKTTVKTNVQARVGPRNRQPYSLTAKTVQPGNVFERDTLEKAMYAATAIAQRFEMAAVVRPVDGTFDVTVTKGGKRPSGTGIVYSAGYATNVG